MSKKTTKQTKINVVENKDIIETRENIVITPSQFDLLMSKLNKLDELDAMNVKLNELDKMNEKLDKLDKLDKMNEKMDKFEDVDTITNKKIAIVFNLINDVLTNGGLQKIEKLDDFIDIDRDDICGPINSNVTDKYEEELKKYYTKTFLALFNKTKMKNYHLSVIKKICKDIGYEFISRDSKKKDSNGYTIYYSIIKRKK